MTTLRKHHSEETKLKMSKVRKDKTWEEIYGVEKANQIRTKLSVTITGANHPMYGRHHSDETKEKIGAKRRGQKATEETMKKLLLRRHRTDEENKEISERQTGKGNTFYGKHHTEESRKKMSEKRRDDVGEKSHNWKGGLSLEPYPIIFNNRLKEHIRNKYNRTCFLCYKSETEMKEKLHIHHIDYNKKNNSEDNLVALCTSCHLKTNGDRIFWQQYFSKLLLPELTFIIQNMIYCNN